MLTNSHCRGQTNVGLKMLMNLTENKIKYFTTNKINVMLTTKNVNIVSVAMLT